MRRDKNCPLNLYVPFLVLFFCKNYNGVIKGADIDDMIVKKASRPV